MRAGLGLRANGPLMARHEDDTAAEANVCAMRARVEDAITSKSSPPDEKLKHNTRSRPCPFRYSARRAEVRPGARLQNGLSSPVWDPPDYRNMQKMQAKTTSNFHISAHCPR